MTEELSGFAATASWLPPGVAARLADDEAHERAQAKRDEAERADKAEARRESGLTAYKAAAEARGEAVSALQLARGEGLGRTVADMLAEATAAADRADAVERARERRETGDWCYLDAAPEPVVHASRSAWPESEYELDRQLRQAQDLSSDLAAYRMRQASRRGDAAAQAHIQAEREQAEARRSQPTGQLTAHSAPAGYMSRVTPDAITGVW